MNTSEAFRIRLADWESDQPALRVIREQVFVYEQSVPCAMEWDEFDSVSQHVLAEAEGRIIGTGRSNDKFTAADGKRFAEMITKDDAPGRNEFLHLRPNCSALRKPIDRSGI